MPKFREPSLRVSLPPIPSPAPSPQGPALHARPIPAQLLANSLRAPLRRPAPPHQPAYGHPQTARHLYPRLPPTAPAWQPPQRVPIRPHPQRPPRPPPVCVGASPDRPAGPPALHQSLLLSQGSSKTNPCLRPSPDVRSPCQHSPPPNPTPCCAPRPPARLLPSWHRLRAAPPCRRQYRASAVPSEPGFSAREAAANWTPASEPAPRAPKPPRWPRAGSSRPTDACHSPERQPPPNWQTTPQPLRKQHPRASLMRLPPTAHSPKLSSPGSLEAARLPHWLSTACLAAPRWPHCPALRLRPAPALLRSLA